MTSQQSCGEASNTAVYEGLAQNMKVMGTLPGYHMDRRVFTAMLPYLTERFGNAASLNHSFGWAAQDACDRAREQVAVAVNAHASREIIFTGSGAEAAELAVRGVLDARTDARRNGIVAAFLPGSAVAGVIAHLENTGYPVTRVPFNEYGQVDPSAVSDVISDRTALVTVPLAHEVLGVFQPTGAISRITRARGVPLHADGGVLLDRITVDVQTDGIDLLSMDGAAVYGPRGVGALFVRGRKPRVTLLPLIDGGGQERGWRSGTLNVPGIVGLGTAFALLVDERTTCIDQLKTQENALRVALTGHEEAFKQTGFRIPGVMVCLSEGVSPAVLVEHIESMLKTNGNSTASVRGIDTAQTVGIASTGAVWIRLDRRTILSGLTNPSDAMVSCSPRLVTV